MTETPPTETENHDMDLPEILGELYRWKWLIICTTFVVGLAAAGIALRMPNVYESSAALIIREPELPITGEYPSVTVEKVQSLPISRIKQPIAPISVEMLLALAESTEILWTVFEGLWETQALERWKDGSSDKMSEFIKFQHSLTTESKTSPGDKISISPIIKLKARAQSPADAQAAVNAWAQVMVAKSRDIYTEGVEALNTFIGHMYQQSTNDLARSEEALATKNLEAAFDLKRVRINAVQEKFIGLEGSIFDLGIELAVNTAAITEGKRRVTTQQYEKEWIGTVAEEAILNAVEYPFDKNSLLPPARRTVEAVEQKLKRAESLRVFRREQNLQRKQKEFEHYQLELAGALRKIANVNNDLPSVRATLDALSGQLETIPEKITLNKAITDDALWNAHVSEKLPENADLVPLKSESLNPLYQSTAKSVVELTAKVETLKASAVQLAESAATATRFIADLESEIDVTQKGIKLRETEVGVTEAFLSLLHKNYADEIERIERLSAENVRKKEEIGTKEKLRRTIAKDVMGLEQHISKYELEISALKREVQKTRGVQISLASKAEEVAQLRIAVENASRTGTTILYGAVANPQKVAPARHKFVLASMLVSFVLCGLLICSAKLIRTAS